MREPIIMGYHPRLSEKLAVVGRIKPQAISAASTATSDIVDMRYISRLMAVVNIGDYAAGNDGAVTVQLYSDSASAMASEEAIEGKETTAASWTGSDGDDAVRIINHRRKARRVGQTQRYVRLKITPAEQNLRERRAPGRAHALRQSRRLRPGHGEGNHRLEGGTTDARGGTRFR